MFSFATIGRNILVLVLLAIIIFTGIINPRFLSLQNILNILQQISVLGIVSIGVTILLISGGLDLSVGSLISLSAYVGGLTIVQTHSLGLGILALFACAVFFGFLNGVLAATERAHPFIITLGTMTFLQGIAVVISRGSPINGMGGLYELIGIRDIFGLPAPAIIFIGLLILSHFFLRNIPLGRYAFAIGGNQEASRLSGIRISRMKIALYALNGLFVGVAALVLSSILDSALPTMGTGYELRSVAAAVIGGTPLFGGRGNVFGTLGGVFLLGLVSNSINLLGISANFQGVVLGAIMVAAVMFQKSQ
ncbi:MAG: Ribose transport system permease protein RbsC [Candidatus Atribacteria bacterium ADurb.Bin276]|jgi:ribose/xylose/arabinose/galactoside ABC-type transport system permease subunit|uniref:Ribose transport system permease protein RbsC n=2 Tax=Atribacter TaxID=2847777 RepID=A0A1V5SKF6_9BACT|nr:MAG: Ribose transport system permease protein RbsC [Candidatus Atribacteria bacterium ADurb.Bin276]